MRVGGGGKKGGVGGPKGATGATKTGKVSFGGKIDKTEAVERTSGVVGAGGVGGVQAADPVTTQALDIARLLKSGQIKSKEEATKKLVAEVLREKVRMQSRALTDRIADTLQDDPRLTQALERLWSSAE
ncbi:MAG: hypothetical protein ACOZIN_09210 [Myxococcota bacterium]